MIFQTLKEKCNFYRGLTDSVLTPNSYFIIMLDGRSFSKKVKKQFKRPFDNDFVDMMNETARHLCEKVQGAKFAYVQSDEISIFCKDEPGSEILFGGRTCKILSICASMATAHFNRLAWKKFPDLETEFEFDAKVWNVPNYNDWRAWFIFRSNDCKRNSILQTADCYLSHKELQNKKCDEVLDILRDEKGIEWNTLPDGLKYGRVITRDEVISNGVVRNKFVIKDSCEDFGKIFPPEEQSV